MALLDGLNKAIGRQKAEIMKELTAVEKTGLKLTLDVRNASLTEMEQDVLDIMDDPLNSADFKLRAINRLIILNLKYVALYDNPKIGKLISAWHNMMANWNILIEDYSSVTGAYAIVEREIVHTYEDGTVQIRKVVERLNPSDFQHQYFRYINGSEWQAEMQKKYAVSEAEKKSWGDGLKFTPIKESFESGESGLTEDEEREAKRIHEDNEYFARVEMIPRGWKVYGWMHREKHTYPNSVIVIQGAPMMPGSNVPQERPSSTSRLTEIAQEQRAQRQQG